MFETRIAAGALACSFSLLAATGSALGQCLEQRIPGQTGAYQLGQALDVSGSIAIVGAQPLSAFLFERRPSGWTRLQELTPGGSTHLGGYGRAVAIDGTTAVVGAETGQSVFVYERSASGWVLVQELREPTFAPGAAFGHSVAIDAGRIAIGAPQAPGGGEAFVYLRTPAGWVREARIPNSSPGHRSFGRGIDIEGDRLAIGAPDELEPWSSRGFVYVYDRGAAGWQETQRLETPLGELNGRLGTDVSLDGDRLAAGEPQRWLNAAPVGAVRIYELLGGAWQQTADILVAEQHSLIFGTSVALDGQRLLAGAPNDSSFIGIEGGAAHFFEETAAGWSEVRKLYPGQPEFQAYFGWAVALEGPEMLVSAPFGPAQIFDPGAVYAYDVGCSAGVTRVCAPSPNSVGSGAFLDAVGPLSVRWNNLELRVSGAAPQQLAVPLYGPAMAPAMVFDGTLCIAAPFHRLPAGSIDAQGHETFELDLGTLSGPGAITAGSTWTFQVAYRDPGGATGTNFSEALSILFAP